MHMSQQSGSTAVQHPPRTAAVPPPAVRPPAPAAAAAAASGGRALQRYAVCEEVRIPPGPSLRVVDALQQHMPQRYPSFSAAKRGVRRREIVADGAAVTDSAT